MKKDIILAGVGGQGILSIATVIGQAALAEGWYLKQAEVHGMSQRGGEVQSHLRISTEPIWSDLIPQGKADIILSLEPLEALRYVPWLAPEGCVVTSSVPFRNIDNYPDIDQVYAAVKACPKHILIDTDALVKEINAPVQAANMVLLGAAIPMLGIEPEIMKTALQKVFARKSEAIVETNIRALMAGYEYACKNL
ncbi:MAG: indolepyruvate oxidoreductase subunit beta [Paludibacteraceae bacterium]|nr:indolepyruvate oxidoreductase subunit beta [Paludibacteraceae bacterium]